MHSKSILWYAGNQRCKGEKEVNLAFGKSKWQVYELWR